MTEPELNTALDIGDVVVSKMGNRWHVVGVEFTPPDAALVELRYEFSQVTTRGPFPDWAARVERDGAILWSRNE